jgi:leucyl-tRNA synthetase
MDIDRPIQMAAESNCSHVRVAITRLENSLGERVEMGQRISPMQKKKRQLTRKTMERSNGGRESLNCLINNNVRDTGK